MLFPAEVSRVYEVAVLIIVHVWGIYHLVHALFVRRAR
jgi:hypothetical protein